MRITLIISHNIKRINMTLEIVINFVVELVT